MPNSEQPLVSVVTPVYNGEKHLAECIESVRDQTYENWEYVVVNNCSTDRSETIARAFAEQDARIRVHNNDAFLALIPNWNNTVRQISPRSKYCKVVHADDLLFPECLARMVAVAERNASVGLVSAYVLKGTDLQGRGFPFPKTVIPGPEAARAHLRRDYYVFGSPSSTMMRADLVRSREPFYNESNLHSDVEACYDVLQESDLGFVYQVLTHTRMHSGTMTATFTDRYSTNALENRVGILQKYGPLFCTEEERQRLLEHELDRYYAELARAPRRLKDKDFRDYHRNKLEGMGLRLNKLRLAKAVAARSARLLTNPKKLTTWLGRRAGLLASDHPGRTHS